MGADDEMRSHRRALGARRFKSNKKTKPVAAVTAEIQVLLRNVPDVPDLYSEVDPGKLSQCGGRQAHMSLTSRPEASRAAVGAGAIRRTRYMALKKRNRDSDTRRGWHRDDVVPFD